jgi:glutamate carboxypeptidase
MSMKRLLDQLEPQTDAMVAKLKEMVERETPSDDKPSLDSFAEYLKAEFGAIPGVKAEVLPQETAGNHVRVRWGEGEGQILMLCHFDTVWSLGETARRPWRISEGKIYGPGAFDMKGGIVQTLFALKTLTSLGLRPERPVTILFNSDEEIGSHSSRPIIEEEARHSVATLVMEPAMADGSLKTWRKGTGGFTVTATGVAAHAGADPEKGVSAIQELAQAILRIHAMNDFKIGTTLNVGVITGGTRSNVVAAEAVGQVDLRAMTMAEGDRIIKEMQSLQAVTPGARLDVTGGLNRPPMERSAGNLALYEKARSLAAEAGVKLTETGTGGGSDGNFTAALGCPTLDGLGCLGSGSHSITENVIIAGLPERTALVAALLRAI